MVQVLPVSPIENEPLTAHTTPGRIRFVALGGGPESATPARDPESGALRHSGEQSYRPWALH